MLDDRVQLSKYIKWKVCDSVENVIEYKFKKKNNNTVYLPNH